MTPWNPHSWQRFPAQQQPAYDDPSELEGILARLRRMPPLVVPEEVDRLRGLLAEAAAAASCFRAGTAPSSSRTARPSPSKASCASCSRCPWPSPTGAASPSSGWAASPGPVRQAPAASPPRWSRARSCPVTGAISSTP
ncbi:MAG: 3-deoxy-7-phosphoheptulonate synthase [Holophagaceae bacterium]|nr:3-deoxy-7-phosphoheptulonate synthase [Holophagaceae bacterium]